MSTRILIIDDDSAMLRLIEHKIAAAYRGVVIDTARHAAEAMERIRRSAPDLLIVDIVMPGTSGVGLISRIRSMKAFSKIRIFSFSAHFKGSGQTAIAAGADAFFQKKKNSIADMVRALPDYIPRLVSAAPACVQANDVAMK